MLIRDKSYFNDRTEIIAYAIQNNFVQLLHPNRSGKSTSLDMMATFLEKKLNSAGERDAVKHQQAEALFFGGDASIND